MLPTPSQCRITVRGAVDAKWVNSIMDMMVDARVADGAVQTTTLLGHPIDLGAFLGAVQMLVDMGFPVMDCEYHQGQ